MDSADIGIQPFAAAFTAVEGSSDLSVKVKRPLDQGSGDLSARVKRPLD